MHWMDIDFARDLLETGNIFQERFAAQVYLGAGGYIPFIIYLCK